MSENCDSWLKSIDISNIPSSKLILISGWVKTTADWSATTFTRSNAEFEVSVGAGASVIGSLDVAGGLQTEIDGPVIPRCGEHAPEATPHLPLPSPPKFDQCIFLRSYNVKHRSFLDRIRILRAGAGPDVLPDQRDANSGRGGSAVRVGDNSEDVEMVDDMVSVLNQLIMNACPSYYFVDIK